MESSFHVPGRLEFNPQTMKGKQHARWSLAMPASSPFSVGSFSRYIFSRFPTTVLATTLRYSWNRDEHYRIRY